MHLIIGMHRSGTSLISRLLIRAGADFGPPEGFITPDRWNPDGYFEQREVLDLNRQLLHGPWGKLVYLALPAPGTVRARGIPLRSALRTAGERLHGRIVKDPRFCITAPAWEESGVAFEKVIVCLRDPWEVALSLRQRNRLPLFLGLRLWEKHFRLNLEFVRNRPHRWLSYSSLLRTGSSVREFAGAARFLGLPFDEGRDADWVRQIVRTRAEDHPVIARNYSPSLTRLWEELRARHAQQE